MPAKGDRNWPDHEVNEFLDQITSGGQDYRRLVERLPVIVYASEMGEDGEWYYVSPQVAEILGYTAEDFKADPKLWASLLHPEDRERALENETEIHLGDRSTRPVEYRMRTRGGETVWMLDEAVLEADEEGVPVWHGVLYDITERKRTEAELQRAAGPAGRGRQARRAGAAGRRPGVADAGRDLADRRSRRRPQRLHLGGRPRRPSPQPSRRPRGRGRRRRSPRLRRPRLPRRRRARVRHRTRSSPIGRARAASRCRRCCGWSAPRAAWR